MRGTSDQDVLRAIHLGKAERRVGFLRQLELRINELVHPLLEGNCLLNLFSDRVIPPPQKPRVTESDMMPLRKSSS